MGNVANIKVEAMKVIYGVDTAQVEKITIPLGTLKADLAGKHFILYSTSALGVIQKYGFWFKLAIGDTAPVIADVIFREVDIIAAGITTPAQFATAIKTAVDLVTGVYTSVAVSNAVTVTHTVTGYAPSAHDALVSTASPNLVYETITQGDKEEDVGCVEGDIEVSFEESFIDITCHAEGITPIGQIKNGISSVEVTLNLEETTPNQLKKMFVKTGGSFIPNAGSELFGMGTHKNFANMFNFATKLRLHPASLALSDKSRDLTFHKAIPNLTGITFSGENVLTLPVTFKVFPAAGVNKRVNYFSYGDSSQALL